MYVTARIICNLLLEAQNMSEYSFCQFSCKFLEILKKLSGCFSHTEYL